MLNVAAYLKIASKHQYWSALYSELAISSFDKGGKFMAGKYQLLSARHSREARVALYCALEMQAVK